MRAVLLYLLFLVLVSCHNPEQVDPTVRTGDVQNIGKNNATFNGKLEDEGAVSTWTYGFIWADFPGSNIVNGNLVVLGERSVTGEFSINQEGLDSDKTYSVKAFVSEKNFSKVFYANEVDFNTLQP